MMIPYPKKITYGDVKRKYDGFYSNDQMVKEILELLSLPVGNTIITYEKKSMKGYAIAFDRHIHIQSNDRNMLLYALVSLKFYLDRLTQVKTIVDEPLYEHRGLMLDVARHFFPVSVIEEILDMMVHLKMNVFHFHLTDDQGWRIPISKYPRLTSVGSFRNQTCVKGRINHQVVKGFYTHDEIKHLVAYGKLRGIKIIPEIDVPGHFIAAISSYPAFSCEKKAIEVATEFGIFDSILCVGSVDNRQMIKEILDEVMCLFETDVIHIGCDEVPKNKWLNCETCQKYMKTKGLKDVHELMTDFIEDLYRYMQSKHQQIIIWNDPLKTCDLPSDIVVQHWMNKKITKAGVKKGHGVIVSDFFHHYFDYPHYMTPLKATYQRDFFENTVGIEGCLWTEHVSNEDKLYEMMLPRLYALAEVAWSFSLDYPRFLSALEKMYPLKTCHDKKNMIKSMMYMLSTVSYHDVVNIIRGK